MGVYVKTRWCDRLHTFIHQMFAIWGHVLCSGLVDSLRWNMKKWINPGGRLTPPPPPPPPVIRLHLSWVHEPSGTSESNSKCFNVLQTFYCHQTVTRACRPLSQSDDRHPGVALSGRRRFSQQFHSFSWLVKVCSGADWLITGPVSFEQQKKTEGLCCDDESSEFWWSSSL